MKRHLTRLIITVGLAVVAGCATEYPSPPTAEEVEAYRKWKDKKESDEFFGRPRYEVGPFRFGQPAKRNPQNYEDRWN